MRKFEVVRFSRDHVLLSEVFKRLWLLKPVSFHWMRCGTKPYPLSNPFQVVRKRTGSGFIWLKWGAYGYGFVFLLGFEPNLDSKENVRLYK